MFKELLERSDSSGSKSTILKPLAWFLSVFIGGMVLLIRVNAPSWTIIFFSIIIGLGISIFCFAFIYCLFKDRDALRSEKYSIQKMAIEKGVYGDNIVGLIHSNEPKALNESKNFSDQSEKAE